MSKKIWYSTPLNLFWNDVYPTQKKITPNYSDEQIYNVLYQQSVKNNDDSFITGLEMWWEDHNKNFLHVFFIDKYLQIFLEDMKLADLIGIQKYLYDYGTDKKIIYLKSNNTEKCVTYYYGIHIPYETDGYAFQISLYENNKIELYYFHGKQFGGLNDSMYYELLANNDKKSIILTNLFRLAINTIAYMNCFPECVVDGVPKITVDRNENRTDKNILLDVSKKITEHEQTERTKRPHFRKGYFKLLRSDFYANKKGELIFVKETMVNGISKTVYTVNNIEKVIDLND